MTTLTPEEMTENIRDLQSSQQRVFARLLDWEEEPRRKPMPWYAYGVIAILCAPAIWYATTRDALWVATVIMVYMFGMIMQMLRAHHEQR